MPIGVILQATVKKELKTCPPDGYVEIKRMNYGESLERKDLMAEMSMEMRDNKTRSKDENIKLQMKMLQEKISLWEFATLIVDHNITDDKGAKLNFKNPSHVKALVGQLGDEITKYINELNSFEDDEETGK